MIRRSGRTVPVLAPLTTLALALALSSCGKKQEPTTPPPTDDGATEAAAEEPAPEPEVKCNYIVLIDAGSSGTRAYTYEIEAAEDGGIPGLVERSNQKVEPGFSSYKAEPAKAGESLAGLLKAEGSVLETLPDECEAKTPTALMATAGMRLLEAEEGGADAVKAIYQAAGEAISGAGLDLRFAGTISGQQEGLYAWLTANYALGTLSGDKPTVGTLDLGGASTQIAFMPTEAGDAPTSTLTLGGKSFNVYAHSYLNYGLQQAIQYVADRSCYPKGLNKGKGRYASCVKKLKPVVTPKKCETASCGLATPGDTKNKLGVSQPPLPKDMQFYAIENYFYTHRLVKAAGGTPAALAEAAGGPKGKTGFCGTKWADITAANEGTPAKYLESACFASAWVSVLLETYGFAKDAETIQWTEEIGETKASWALGAALCSITGCLSAK